jgi:hypothetical protein
MTLKHRGLGEFRAGVPGQSEASSLAQLVRLALAAASTFCLVLPSSDSVRARALWVCLKTKMCGNFNIGFGMAEVLVTEYYSHFS